MTGFSPITHTTQGVSELTEEELQEVFLKAAEYGTTDVVKELHQLRGNDILAAHDTDQYTPLHRASYNGHLETVKYLIGAGARLDSRTVDGWEALHCACRWNNASVADVLLQNGALINAQTAGKQTPLHLAAANERARQTLLVLLNHPALDTSLRNGQGDRAVDVAMRCGRHGPLFDMVDESIDYHKFLLTDTHSSPSPSQ